MSGDTSLLTQQLSGLDIGTAGGLIGLILFADKQVWDIQV